MSKTTSDQVKTLLSGVGAKIKEVGKRIPVKLSQLENDLEHVNPDWNQIDETQADYIKNRPCYVAVKSREEQLFDTHCVLTKPSAQQISYNGEISNPDGSIVFKEGSLYNVYFEGVLYKNLTCFRDSSRNNLLTIGESYNSMSGTWGKNDYSYMKYPFALIEHYGVRHAIVVIRTLGNFINGSEVRVVLSEVIPEEVQTLPEKYLPESVIKHVVLNVSSSTGTNGNVTYSGDKTFDEITAALVNRYDVVAYYDGYRYEFHGDRDTDWSKQSRIVFGRCDISANGDSNDAMIKPTEIGLFRDNSVHISDEGFSKLNTTDKSIIGAINEVNEKVDTVNDAIGTDELNTTDKTIIGAINEVIEKATPFIINVTGSGTDDDPYVSDKTFEEIKLAYDDGRELKCLLDCSVSLGVTDDENITIHGLILDLDDFNNGEEFFFHKDTEDGVSYTLCAFKGGIELIAVLSYLHATYATRQYTPTEDYHPATKKYVDDSRIQPDWNEEDEKALGYIRNKPDIPTDAVHYTEQTLTDEQQTQVRTNIGAASQTEVDRLSEEIADYSSHKSNTTMHVTSAEKQVWNNKVDASQLPTIVQEAGESETSVMSQKATTDLIKSMIPETDETEYETVDSVAEMTDTSKQYVLSSTGTVWTYGEVTENVNVNDQIFDASKAFTGHTSGVNIISSSNKIYPLPVDISAIPEGIDAYVEIDGFYKRNATSPYMEKVGFSALENPKQGNSQILNSFYVSTEYLDLVSTTKGCRIKVGYGTNTANTTAVKLDGYETIKTMLLEILPKQTHDASTIKVYLQYSYSGIVTKWYDTELEPSTTGGGGGNTIELLVKINQNTTDIYEMGQRVTALETGSDTLTIPSFWQSAVDECISKIKALQVGRNCVTVPFFSDNHQRNGYAGMLIAYIMKECNIPYAFFGGDSISSGVIADEATMIEQDRLFDASMAYIPNGRFCRAVGNHDGYWTDGTNKFNYNRNQIYELFLREEAIAQNKHFGDDGTYYYVDDVASKTRFIVMNTNGGGVDATQLSWVQNTALSFNESGWDVVFISHQPISNHYHAGISNAAEVVSAIVSTASAKNVDIICWISGHVHRDILATKLMKGGNGSNAGTEVSDLGFTQVIITSDHTGIAYDDATKHTVANDDKSHAIDFLTFNKGTRFVNITRLGIGNDRSFAY